MRSPCPGLAARRTGGGVHGGGVQAVALSVVVAVAVVSGCAAKETTQVARPAVAQPSLAEQFDVPEDAALARMETSGGMCANGPCGGVLTVRLDGTYTYAAYGDTLDGVLGGALTVEDFDRLSRTLTGPPVVHDRKAEAWCASYADGTDLTLTYREFDAERDGSRLRTVSSCEYDFTGDPMAEALLLVHEHVLHELLDGTDAVS